MAASPQVHPGKSTMMAAYVNKFCAVGTVPETISFGPVPEPPAPMKSEVVIGIRAASINVDDVPLLQDTAAGGWFYHARTPSASNPLVGGSDYAGVVLACGPDCKKLKVGDRVCGLIKVAEYQAGTWAEKTIAPESDVCLIQDASISFVDAAAVVMGAFVDADMLKQSAKTLAGGNQRCLVIGASGALGTVMVQLLHHRKYHVTAVCSGSNAEMVKGLGADEVIDYTASPFGSQLAGAGGFAVVFDFVGGEEAERSSAPLLVRGGSYITATGDRQNVGDRSLSCGEWFASLRHILGHALCGYGCCCAATAYKYAMSGAYPPLTEEVWRLHVLEDGARAAVAEEVPFAEAPLRAALKRVASHHPGGRVVINMERSS